MIADLIHLLTRANLAGAAAILLVLTLRGLVRRGLGAQAAYALWLVPPLMAAASLVPFPTALASLPPLVLRADFLAAPRPMAASPVWPALAATAWAAGAALAALFLTLQQGRFVAGMGRLTSARIAGLRVLRAARCGAGPAVVGGAIVLPPDFEARFTAAEQEAVLAHEAQHLARGDVAANGLLALLQCLCWFNPLVHLAARQVRFDQELACDAAVLAARPALRRPYAEALLKTQIVPCAPPLGCAWPPRAVHPLKARIALLKSAPPSRRRRVAAAALLAGLVLGGGYTAWAAQPGAGRVVDPDWVQRPTGADLARFYPAAAAARKQGGQGVMQCRVQVSGTLSSCTVLRQAPQGAGFGEAMLQMAPLFRMRPQTKDGAPVAGGVVRIPIMFKIAAGS
jgi:TonB family protein